MCGRRVGILSRFDIALSLLQSLTHSHTVLRHLCFLPTIIYMHLCEFTISCSSPVISTGGYQRNQHYGGGNYHSGYFRPNKQYEISYGDLFPNKHGSGYKH
ncbi:Immunogenic miracidial antigen 8I [Schistosoma japonicum]|uniref:Immunogenic miracidial antigen 8I n=1 Tax=Schistosoma japonicum TaxID=6182 RepID=A0A4Z2DQA0_SCHJA|nr:Immunogenic miracidial antigen 8I [Schistosoma japonicum]